MPFAPWDQLQKGLRGYGLANRLSRTNESRRFTLRKFRFLVTKMMHREPRRASDIEGGVLFVAKNRTIRRKSLRDLIYAITDYGGDDWSMSNESVCRLGASISATALLVAVSTGFHLGFCHQEAVAFRS